MEEGRLTTGIEKRLLGREAAAAYINITIRSLERLVKKGILTPVRIVGFRRTLFDRQDLDGLVESSTQQAVQGVQEGD
jgi:excisionase family DNA binding protein